MKLEVIRISSQSDSTLGALFDTTSGRKFLGFTIEDEAREDKVQGEKEASFQKRFFDLTQPFFIAIENPLTGIGLDAEQF